MKKELLDQLLTLWASREKSATSEFLKLLNEEFGKLTADDQMQFLDRWAEETNRLLAKQKLASLPLAQAA